MKYNIGDLFIWKYDREQISTLIETYYDWDGETRYVLQSWLIYPVEQYIKESYIKEELDKFIKGKILEHYPVK